MRTIYIILFALFLTLVINAQTKTEINCKIWKPKSFCEIPDSIYFADRVFGMKSSWKFTTCQQLDSINNSNNLIGVWLTFYNKKSSSLNFKTNFENIKLIKKNNGQKVNLSAIYFANKIFYTSIEAKKYKNHFKAKHKVNFIMLFPQADKGDKIVIDDFIEAEIQ